MAKKKHKKSKRERRRMLDQNAQPQGNGPLAGLSRLLPEKTSEQFLLGALLGAAATYILADENLRGKLLKSGIKLYSCVIGGIEEMKEQAADIQAEIMAEQTGAI